jgi:glycosyltransferase involved in cell wall biosynthesis
MDAERLIADALPQTVGRPVVTYLGRLTAKKRVPLLLEAFSRIDGSSAYLVVAGPDSDGLLGGYRARASGLGIEDRVSFPGAVYGPLKEALLARSSTFVLPSADENMGVAVLEAMAHAVPVVLTPGVALHQEVEAAGCGLVVPPDRDSLAAAIQSIITQPDLARAMGQAGVDLVRRRYSLDVEGRQLEAAYVDILFRAGVR